MKLTRSIKRVWAYVLVVALVISSMVGYQAKSVVADVTDWSAIAYAGDGAGGGAYSNLYKFYCDNANVNLVNIQAPGFASEAGLYVTTPAGISQVSVDSDIQGAGVILHLSAFTAKETMVTITDAQGTYTCYVYYENGVAGGEIPTTTGTTEAETTEAETSADGFIPLTTEEWKDMGAWTTYFGVSWANATGAYKGGATLNDFTLRVDSNNYQGYGIQAKAKGLVTVANTTYKATIKFNSSAGGFDIASKVDGITDEVSYSVLEGTNTIETIFVAKATSTDIFFNFTGVLAGTTFTFSEVSVAVADKTPEMIEKERVEALFASSANIALNKTATASSTAATDKYLASEAFDGSLGSRWAAATYNQGEWIAVNLGAVYNITSVAFAWEGAYASQYIIQVSDDGETYTDVSTVTATKAETLEKQVTAKGQYVRIYCVSNGLAYPYSIWEIAVLGTLDGEEVTTEEATTEEVTTEETTTEEVTTEAQVADWTAAAINQDPWANLGAYTYYVGNWGDQNATASYKGGDRLDNLSFRIDSNAGYASYIIQLMTKGFTTEAGKNYKYVVEFNSNTAGSVLQTKIEGVSDLVDHTLVEGRNNIEVPFTATGESSQVFIHLAYVAVGTELEFTNVAIVEATEEVTTEGVTTEETTAEEATTEEADDLVYSEVIGANDIVTKGNYNVWVCSTNTMMFAVDSDDAGHISGYIVNNNNNWDMWAVQYIIQKDDLTPGKTYTISVDFEAGSDDGTITTDAGETFALSTLFDGTTSEDGKVTLTKTMEADANGTIKFVIGAGQVGYGVTIDLSNVVVESDEAETTTAEAETTTVAPTKAPETTTVAPTTSGDKQMKKPAKVTIKKVYAKKKAAKVVKIKINNVKGATAYQVQISKAKKFTKKNILVNKKSVKKLKPAIKSKKLANKKTLYVRVRAYVKTADGSKVYGKWSKGKKVRIK